MYKKGPILQGKHQKEKALLAKRELYITYKNIETVHLLSFIEELLYLNRVIISLIKIHKINVRMHGFSNSQIRLKSKIR